MCDTVFSCASTESYCVSAKVGNKYQTYHRSIFLRKPKKHASEKKQKIIQPQATWISTLDFPKWGNRGNRHDSVIFGIWQFKFGDVQKTGERFSSSWYQADNPWDMFVPRRVIILITFILHLGRFPNFSYILFTTFFSDELKWLALKHAKVTPNIEVS